MYVLRIVVIHALGNFAGTVQMKEEDATYDNVKDLMDVLQETINRLERLVIVRDDGVEVAFNSTILKDAILTFKIEEVE